MDNYVNNNIDNKEELLKTAGLLGAAGKIFENNPGIASIPIGIIATKVVSSWITDIKNDFKKKKIFEELSFDPELKSVDKGTLLEWYATINHYSPTTALNKTASKELLRQFAMFGRVDIQTLKTLSEIEKNTTDSSEKKNSWVNWIS